MLDALRAAIYGVLNSFLRPNVNGCNPSFGIWIIIFGNLAVPDLDETVAVWTAQVIHDRPGQASGLIRMEQRSCSKSIRIFRFVILANCLVGAAFDVFSHTGRQLFELPALLIDQLLELIRQLVVAGSGSADQML